jgi:hypothetical protein
MDLDFFKRYPIFTALLAVCLLGFAVEVFFVFKSRTVAGKAHRSLASAESSLSAALSVSPAATDANLQAAKQNVADLQGQLDGIVKTLQATGNFSPAPADAVTLLADIQHFVDNFNSEAKEKQIVISDPANFTFGMGQYVGPVAPPPPDKIALVFKQMEILEYILNQLFAAKPADQAMMLETVERENEVPVTNTGNNNSADQGPKETFAVDPLVSARVTGAVDTLAFRIKFIAYSDALRAFLNELAQFDYPLVVRSVEVQPATQDTLNAAMAAANPSAAPAGTDTSGVTLGGGAVAATGTDTGNQTAAAPAGPVREAVIKDNLSEFTVVIEYINLIPPKPTGAPSP